MKFKFDQVAGNDFLGIVRFYEENYPQIFSLDIYDQQYFKYHYLFALFNLGRYEQVLFEIDPLIEFVFRHEVNFEKDDSFESLIFKKAASHLNCQNWKESIQFSTQLIKINPHKKEHQGLLLKALQSKHRYESNTVRFVAISLILLSASLSAVIWALKNYSPQQTLVSLFYVSLGISSVALSVLAINHFAIIWKSRKTLRSLIPKK